ncbi:MAG: dihydrodipicolinate synthase family protein [Chloroflexota bacterium]
MNYQNIKGVIVPLLTPFDEAGELNPAALPPLIDYLIERGVAGLFPLGTTGEGPLLTPDERQRLAEAVVRAAGGRVPVIVHTGDITTRGTIALTQHAQAIGANAAAIITPYYFRLSNEALIRHFQTVAEAVPDFPLYLYANPAVANNPLSSEVVIHLAENTPNIIGLKDSSGSLDVLFTAKATLGDRFNTAIGPDSLIMTGIGNGLDACVSGNANVVPELVVALYNAASRGDLATARELQAKLDAVRRILKDGADLSLYKGMMAKRGLPVGDVRAPLPQAPQAAIDACWQALSALELHMTAL